MPELSTTYLFSTSPSAKNQAALGMYKDNPLFLEISWLKNPHGIK